MADIGKAKLFRISARTFGTRVLDLFSAIDEHVEEKGKKVVYYVYFVPKSPYCSSISVPKLFPNCTCNVPDMRRYEARNGDPKPCPEGEITFISWFVQLITW